MRLLISLSDFPAYVPFSVNIGPHLVTPHIRDAQEFEVGPLLSAGQWAQLVAALDALPPAFVPVPLESAEFGAAALLAGWPTAALATLWYGSLRPLLVCESARRMLLWHGLHITPAGSEVLSAQPISGAQRTELRADLENKAGHYRHRLAAALLLAFPSTTPATCYGQRRRRGSGGLQTSAI